MNIYLAGKPGEHEQLNAFADELKAIGLQVVSTWHNDSKLCDFLNQHWAQLLALEQNTAQSLAALIEKPSRIGAAQTFQSSSDLPNVASSEALHMASDLFEDEIDSAEYVVANAADSGMEAGYGLAMGKRVILIGDCQSPLVSYFDERVKFARDWTEAKGLLFAAHQREVMGGKLTYTK